MYKKEKSIKGGHGGCLCCPNTEEILPMKTRLYNGFGGWYISKNGQEYFTEDPDKEFNETKTLSQIERKAKLEPDEDWRAHLNLPLRDAVYQRQGKSKWVLIEKGNGFA
jgi:hypothetical protein